MILAMHPADLHRTFDSSAVLSVLLLLLTALKTKQSLTSLAAAIVHSEQ